MCDDHAIQRAIMEIVQKISHLALEEGAEELLVMDYMERGMLDSFQVLDFITQLEQMFSIKFSTAHLSSDAFHTLKGVCALVVQLVREKQREQWSSQFSSPSNT